MSHIGHPTAEDTAQPMVEELASTFLLSSVDTAAIC